MDTFDTLPSGVFRPKESLSMGAQLHRILRNAIIQGELVPGQAISEVEMSKRFSISRQPVREAFIKLAEERLIEVLDDNHGYALYRAVSGLKDCPYAVPFRVQWSSTPTPVPVGVWRSVGHSHNGFFLESLIDEAARAARAS